MKGTLAKFCGIAAIGLIAGTLAVTDARPVQAQAGGAVEMVFLGNMGFKFTSPDGLVIFTDPWLDGNPDAPMAVADVERRRAGAGQHRRDAPATPERVVLEGYGCHITH
jgi:hypothetical protein